jgi:hypothetical protein
MLNVYTGKHAAVVSTPCLALMGAFESAWLVEEIRSIIRVYIDLLLSDCCALAQQHGPRSVLHIRLL